ncbi:hypothetical protein KKG22_04125 [Patescibacteria group bacterium]|nr:hypothetical protein [Patescibacteria group bacterium]MBU1721329.1 hypothetical protein [Patescibacteria group bacterium]MBU1901614.1 hypothetical protein [Patescibacteria group bacterium]
MSISELRPTPKSELPPAMPPLPKEVFEPAEKEPTELEIKKELIKKFTKEGWRMTTQNTVNKWLTENPPDIAYITTIIIEEPKMVFVKQGTELSNTPNFLDTTDLSQHISYTTNHYIIKPEDELGLKRNMILLTEEMLEPAAQEINKKFESQGWNITTQHIINKWTAGSLPNTTYLTIVEIKKPHLFFTKRNERAPELPNFLNSNDTLDEDNYLIKTYLIEKPTDDDPATYTIPVHQTEHGWEKEELSEISHIINEMHAQGYISIPVNTFNQMIKQGGQFVGYTFVTTVRMIDPTTEQTYIFLKGTDADNPDIPKYPEKTISSFIQFFKVIPPTRAEQIQSEKESRKEAKVLRREDNKMVAHKGIFREMDNLAPYHLIPVDIMGENKEIKQNAHEQRLQLMLDHNFILTDTPTLHQRLTSKSFNKPYLTKVTLLDTTNNRSLLFYKNTDNPEEIDFLDGTNYQDFECDIYRIQNIDGKQELIPHTSS